ncbi:MAG TPA: HAMP domain-containing histidine kinase [Actinobacteria bacterium]|nr:HAMP domain-containing histidine kinase [Actinomycetota bacterium]
MNDRTKTILRGAAAGLLLGLVFPVVAAVVGLATTDSATSLLDLRRAQPVTWLIDLFPFLLAALGGVLASVSWRFRQLESHTEEIAARVVEEWNAQIHETNEEIARSARSQARFFAALSHDMRTPLSAIIGFSTLIEEEDVDPEMVRSMAADIRSSASQLLTMVNDLLDAARMESGKIDLEIVDVDAEQMVHDIARHMGPLAEEKHLELHLDLEPGLECRADPQRLRQILINLLSNAIKYTDDGGIWIRGRTVARKVFIEVEDTGAGIAPEDVPAVFTPFEQTRVAQQRVDSTGLGLPISLGLAQAMGGTIEFYSDGPGKGSTFTLVIPAASGAPAENRVATLPALSQAA